MSHFAQVQNGVIVQVIVAEQSFIDSGAVGNASEWVQTSYNTRGGVHYGQDGVPDGGTPLRKNYAGIGFTYDAQRDAFIPPKLFASWALDEQACLWVPPTPKPDDGELYMWDEASASWVVIVGE